MDHVSICDVHSNIALICFTSDIIFDRKACRVLSEEIDREREDLSLQIIVLGSSSLSDDNEISDRVLGVASVNLWFMIEDSCGIVLQVLYRFFCKINCCFS